MSSKSIGIALAVAVLIGGVSFWGGMTYAQSARASRGQLAGQFQGGGARGGFRGSPGGGAAFGTIIAKDANSITVQLGGPNATSTNGGDTGTKLVLYSGSTEIGKTVVGSASDLTTGENVVVNGTANSDGSVTAQTIQIRPAPPAAQH